jgi:hypothetical protein
MFTSSVLRTQLEMDLMLKQIDDAYITANIRKRKACFLPLFDTISTHCRLMCHELKPHVKLYLMLTNPAQLAEEISSQFIKIKLKQFEQNDIKSTNSRIATTTDLTTSPTPPAAGATSVTTTTTISNSNEFEDVFAKTKIHKPSVPILLKDPIACLLLIIVNLPTNVDKIIFKSIVQSLFNMVYIQNLIFLSREFDENERSNWSNNSGIIIRWNTFKDYVANIINYLKKTTILTGKKNENAISSTNSNYIVQTIWSLESAKNYVKLKCLHYLKISSLLQYYLYGEEIDFNQFVSILFLEKFLHK